MTGTSHFRVRGVRCGRCDRVHTWYKYRVWREGKKIKEEYVGKCDRYGNMERESTKRSHKRQEQQERARQQAYTNPRPLRSPYEILGITYSATRAEINRAYRNLVKQYHPDLNKHIDPALIVEINVAYQILTK
jgi:DnaJ-class molecular chaperone